MKVEKVVKHVTDRIENYLKHGENNLDKVHLFNRQLALGENNVINLLFILNQICIEIDKKESTRLILNNLVSICKNNYTTQA